MDITVLCYSYLQFKLCNIIFCPNQLELIVYRCQYYDTKNIIGHKQHKDNNIMSESSLRTFCSLLPILFYLFFYI